MLMRLILVVMLSAGLLVSGTVASYSKGVMAGSQAIVICSPQGVHEIVLGANGEPITVTHNCFDCCPVSVDALAANWPEFIRPYGRVTAVSIVAMQAMESHISPSANARAPPIVV